MVKHSNIVFVQSTIRSSLLSRKTFDSFKKLVFADTNSKFTYFLNTAEVKVFIGKSALSLLHGFSELASKSSYQHLSNQIHQYLKEDGER